MRQWADCADAQPTADKSDAGAPAAEALAQRLAVLMAAYQAGDAAAVEELVAAVNPILSRYYYSLTGNASQLDDLLQDCWLRVHRARHSYRPGEPVLPWLFAISRYSKIDSYRKWQRTSGREASLDAVAEPGSPHPEARWQASLEAEGIVRLMQSLPEGQREVMTMLKLGEMSVEEVANATGLTVPAVKQKAYRAYQAIRAAIKSAGKGREPSDL